MVGLKHAVLVAPAAMVVGSVAMTSTAAAEDGFRFYGFLNGAVTSVDDGVQRRNEFSDNSNAPSRIGAWYEMGTNAGTLKFNFETALGLRGTSSLSMGSNDDFFDWDKTDLRKFEAIYETERFGTVYVGQGSMASDGISGGTDMSGTDLSGTVAIADTAGGFAFQPTGGGAAGPTIGDVFKDFDGSRKGRVRYDTPSFGGFVVSASAGTEILKDNDDTNFYDVALRYGNDFGDTTFKATLAYAQTDGASDDSKSVLGSVGALHNPTGISGTLTVGQNDRDSGLKSDYVYAKVGLQRDWFSFGRTHLSVDAYRGNDMASVGDKSVSYGFEAVQKIDNANVDLFFSYHQHGYDVTTGTTYNDVDAYMLGARWSF
ncbi:MAG: porin [Shimia sp.]|uniref:porin n=1 Tax=Shimia sp. TaxID=1954381 RepID=UPI001B05BD5A|nr:porin [Shimia sp.]MBO6896954.1 porin [Shimia sp.]